MLAATAMRADLTAPQSAGDRSTLELLHGRYVARFAATQDEIAAAQRLRFEVFNLELGEGLQAAHLSGRDADDLDSVCVHLIVEYGPTREVVGTYRLQSGTNARDNLGYYSEREFDFSPYETLRSEILELGRACIHREHRSTDVLYLLWRGIAAYALECKARYLIGCSSLTSQDPAHGTAVCRRLRDWQVTEELRTVPLPPFAMPLLESANADSSVPKLLRTYLSIGAKICGPPAIDREFKTIDFLTLLDLEQLHPGIRSRFLKR